MLIFLPHHQCHAINKTCITYYNLKLKLTCIPFDTLYFQISTEQHLKHHNLNTFKSKSRSGMVYTLNEYCRNHAWFYKMNVDNSRVTPIHPNAQQIVQF